MQKEANSFKYLKFVHAPSGDGKAIVLDFSGGAGTASTARSSIRASPGAEHSQANESPEVRLFEDLYTESIPLDEKDALIG